MAALDMPTLIAGIRRFCGSPVGDNLNDVDPEVTDSDITLFVGWAVRDILLELKGKKTKSTYLTTVAGQQLYDAIAGAGEIIEVHYGGIENSDALFASVLNPALYPSSPLSGADLGERSLSLINEIQERELYRLSRFGKSWDVVEGKICLIPVPETSGMSVYYEYVEDTGSISELDDTYTRLIYLKASTHIFAQMIAARSSIAQVGRGGFQNSATLPDLSILKSNNEKEFEREIQRISKRMVG
jgi:hypothetical protein